VAEPAPAVPVLPVRPPLRGRGRREGGLRVTRSSVLLSLGVHAVLAVVLILGIDEATHRQQSRQAREDRAEQVSYLDVSEWPRDVPSGSGAPAAAAPAGDAQGISSAAMDSAVARLPELQRFPDRAPAGIPAAPRTGGRAPATGAQPGTAAGVPGATGNGNGNAINGDAAGGPLGTGYGDRRLIVRPEAVPERQKTDHERYMDHLGQVLGTWNDSVAAEAEHQHRIHNWTVRDKQGREWGIGQGGVPIIAGHRIPVPIAPPIHVDRDREEAERAQARQRAEIDRQAEDTDRDRNFRERTRAIRQHQDEERRKRREQNGGSDGSSSPSSTSPSSGSGS
jgi:hypothetical protein